MRACKGWPKYNVEEQYLEPLESNIPTLIISGDHDPVTPPRWGDAMAKKLTSYQHIKIKYLSHLETGLSNLDCFSHLFSAFYLQPTGIINDDCINEMKPMEFRITNN